MTRCRWRVPGYVLVLLASAGGLTGVGKAAELPAGGVALAEVPVQGGRSARVAEAREQRPVTDDPVVSGSRDRAWARPMPPEAPPQPPDVSPTEGAFGLLPEVRFAPVVEAELAPGASREVELPVDAPSVLLASARWIGTGSPLQVSLSLDGATLATGTGARSAGDGGRAVLRAMTAGPGRGALSVTNTSDATVALRLVLGALDRRSGGEE